MTDLPFDVVTKAKPIDRQCSNCGITNRHPLVEPTDEARAQVNSQPGATQWPDEGPYAMLCIACGQLTPISQEVAQRQIEAAKPTPQPKETQEAKASEVETAGVVPDTRETTHTDSNQTSLNPMQKPSGAQKINKLGQLIGYTVILAAFLVLILAVVTPDSARQYARRSNEALSKHRQEMSPERKRIQREMEQVINQIETAVSGKTVLPVQENEDPIEHLRSILPVTPPLQFFEGQIVSVRATAKVLDIVGSSIVVDMQGVKCVVRFPEMTNEELLAKSDAMEHFFKPLIGVFVVGKPVNLRFGYRTLGCLSLTPLAFVAPEDGIRLVINVLAAEKGEEILRRTLTDRSGEYNADVYVTSYDGKQVSFIRAGSNSESSIAFWQLSEDDQRWILTRKDEIYRFGWILRKSKLNPDWPGNQPEHGTR